MKVLDPGHAYELDNLDSPSGRVDYIRFVKREGPKFPGNVGHWSGTTSQEVLRALIDRAIYVNGQIRCWETTASIYLMGLVIWLYEHRAAKRHGRKAPSFHDATYGEKCPDCGHVGCAERKKAQGREG